MVISISDKAKEKLEDVINEKNADKSLRIYIAGYGWGGPSFGIALDEPREYDEKVEVEGFNIAVADDLKDTYKSFSIDYSDSWLRSGFTVSPR